MGSHGYPGIDPKASCFFYFIARAKIQPMILKPGYMMRVGYLGLLVSNGVCGSISGGSDYQGTALHLTEYFQGKKRLALKAQTIRAYQSDSEVQLDSVKGFIWDPLNVSYWISGDFGKFLPVKKQLTLTQNGQLRDSDQFLIIGPHIFLDVGAQIAHFPSGVILASQKNNPSDKTDLTVSANQATIQLDTRVGQFLGNVDTQLHSDFSCSVASESATINSKEEKILFEGDAKIQSDSFGGISEKLIVGFKRKSPDDFNLHHLRFQNRADVSIKSGVIAQPKSLNAQNLSSAEEKPETRLIAKQVDIYLDAGHGVTRVFGEGDVEFLFHGGRVIAHKMEYDATSQNIVFYGLPVKVYQPDFELMGKKIMYFGSNQQWVAYETHGFTSETPRKP